MSSVADTAPVMAMLALLDVVAASEPAVSEPPRTRLSAEVREAAPPIVLLPAVAMEPAPLSVKSVPTVELVSVTGEVASIVAVPAVFTVN